MILNFNRIIPEEDLIGRIMGPDEFNGYSYVQAVFHSPEGKEGKTVCTMLPYTLDMPRKEDAFNQPRVDF